MEMTLKLKQLFSKNYYLSKLPLLFKKYYDVTILIFESDPAYFIDEKVNNFIWMN